jgi:hypothetical protein
MVLKNPSAIRSFNFITIKPSMMLIIINVTGDYSFINGSYNGKPFAVSYNQDRYDAMLGIQEKVDASTDMDEIKSLLDEFEQLAQEDYSDTIETQSPYVKVNKKTGQFHLQYNGVVSKKAMPAILANKIIKAVEKGIEIKPLVKCWARFLRNPFFSDKKAALFAEYISAPYVNESAVAEYLRNGMSEEIAKKQGTTTQVAITKEGLLVCYKVSLEIREKFVLGEDESVQKRSLYAKSIDPISGAISYAEPDADEERYYEPPVQRQNGDAFYCIPGATQPSPNSPLGHIMKVGHLIGLPSWDMVDTRDKVSGVKGLHVGGLNYIKGYQDYQGSVTHNILVDPMHIGAIVGLGNGSDGAMRVKQYFILSTFNGVNKNIYHSSQYAALTDEEYRAMIQEVVTKTAEENKDRADTILEREALGTL